MADANQIRTVMRHVRTYELQLSGPTISYPEPAILFVEEQMTLA